MSALSQGQAGLLALALSGLGCAVYGPNLVGGGGEGATGATGATASGMSSGATSGSGAQGATGGDAPVGASGGTAGSAGSGGTGGDPPDLTQPYVSGGTEVPPIMVNLTNEGFRDWGHWGLKTAGDFNHKAGVTSHLLDFKPLGEEVHEFKLGGPITLTWRDGMPTAMATTTNGVTWTGLDQGFEVVLPAADEELQAHLYIGVFSGSAEIKASLNDPEAVNQVEDHISAELEEWNLRMLTVRYGFAAPGSEVSITVRVSDALNAMAAVSLHGITVGGP